MSGTKDIEEILRLADTLSTDILNAPDEEILQEVRENGGDPAAVSASERKLYEQTAITVAKKRLAANKAAVAAARRQTAVVVPFVPKDARAKLERLLATNADLRDRYTLAARKGMGEASDEEVRDMLEDFADLGVLLDDVDSDE
jgi:hypothetical protein